MPLLDSAIFTRFFTTANTLNNMASLYVAQGKYEQALSHFQRSLAISEKNLGKEHSSVAKTLHNLAELYSVQGKYEQALPLFQRSLAIFEKALGSEHPSCAQIMKNMANLYWAQGKYERALPVYQRALAVAQKSLGDEHPEVATTLGKIANLYMAQGKYEQALSLHQRALAIFEKSLGNEHPFVGIALNNMAEFYSSRGKSEQALSFLRRALTINEKSLGDEHPEVAIVLNNMARTYDGQGKAEKALLLHRRSLAIREKTLGQTHPSVGIALNNIASIYQKKGKYAQALTHYHRGLVILENGLGKAHPSVAIPLHNLALVYWAQGRISHAADYLRRADVVQAHNIRVGIDSASESDKHMFMATMMGELHSYIAFAIETELADADQLATARLFRRKGRVLDDMTASMALLRRQAGSSTAPLLAEYQSVRSQYATQLRRGPGEIPLAQHRANLQTLRARLHTLERDVAQRSKPFRPGRQRVTVEAVQRTLSPRTALIEWVRYQRVHPKAHISRPHYAVMVLKSEGRPQWLDLGDAAEIDNLVHTLRNRMNRKHADVPALARQLYTRLMTKPMAHIGHVEYLYLAPDAALNQVSFAALMDEGGRYLIETHGLSYLTSGRDLLRMAEIAEPKSPALIIADPDYGQPRPGQLAFQPIPKAAEEANRVQTFLPSAQVLSGTDAREKRIIDVPAPEVLHWPPTDNFSTPTAASKTKTNTSATTPCSNRVWPLPAPTAAATPTATTACSPLMKSWA